ncbi:MAG: hypothetical protein P1V97_30255 [Planctomycetota bacterium]|nr:hypothetical protein [Planctomycetota bacterium]
MSKKSWASPLVVAVLSVGLIGCDTGSRNGSSNTPPVAATAPDLAMPICVAPNSAVGGTILFTGTNPTPNTMPMQMPATNLVGMYTNIGQTAAGPHTVDFVEGSNGTALINNMGRAFERMVSNGTAATATQDTSMLTDHNVREITALRNNNGNMTMNLSTIIALEVDSQNSVQELLENNNVGVNSSMNGAITTYNLSAQADLAFASFIGFATGGTSFGAPSSFNLLFDIQNVGGMGAANSFTIAAFVTDSMNVTATLGTVMQTGLPNFSAPTTITLPCMYTGSSGGTNPMNLTPGLGVITVQLDVNAVITQAAVPNDFCREIVTLQ